MARADLDQQAREFTARISRLLNNKPFLFDGGGYLRVGYQLCLDHAGRHLTTAASTFEVFADAEMRQMLCHFDYERDKLHYPDAHIGAAP